LNFQISYAILQVGKEKIVSLETQTKTHERQLVGFLVFLFWMARPDHQACYRLVLIIKPFAYVGGNYTCCDREDKRENNF